MAAPKSLGLVKNVTPGTPVQLSAASLPMNALKISPVHSVGPVVANTGAIYIGLANMVRATGVGVLAIIRATDPPFVTSQPTSRETILDDASNYWIDADTAGDGAVIGVF